MEKIFKAINYMVDVHRKECRKGNNLPKSSHLFSVAAILLKHGYPDDVVVAGLLHDVVEDTDHNIEEIEKKFGSTVAEYVWAETEIAKSNPWRLRKETQIKKIKKAKEEVKVIAAADKLHNLYSLYEDYALQGEDVWQNFNAEKKEIIWYYETVTAAICHNVEGEIFSELKFLLERIGELNGKDN